jgi:DNA-binding CsgD family transcriptional regulator
MSELEWKEALERGDAFGDISLRRSDGGTVDVGYAAHPEIVTGRRLVLFVAIRIGRRTRTEARARRRGHSGPGALSEREREVIALVAEGRTGPEIARELHISHDTVRTHVRNAQSKLGARSRAQLVAMTLGEGHHLAPRRPTDAARTPRSQSTPVAI